MLHKTFILFILFLLVGLLACKKSESPVEVVSEDMTQPNPVYNLKIENKNGASVVSYTLPNDRNILYVLAEYPISGSKTRQSKVSYYQNEILLEGFAEAKEYEVTLYTVSRADVKSEPVTLTVQPLTPDYLLINESLDISPDFGGASFLGENPNQQAISLHFMTLNKSTQEFEEYEPEYVHGRSIDLSIRNLAPEPQKVGVYTQDQYGNQSPVRYAELTPLFEVLLDKSKFFTYPLASDAPIGYGWDFKNLFDGSLNDPGWHTGSAPVTQGTFGLGQLVKISRFVFWNRLPDMFGYQNPRTITLWGSALDHPGDATLPSNAAQGTVSGDWIHMGDFTMPDPPSGLPANQANASDNAFAAEGINFKMPGSAPEVKYIRLVVKQTWGGLDYTNAMEISLYGSPL